MTGFDVNSTKHLVAIARAIHRAVDFLETRNLEAFNDSLATAACEPARFAREKQFSAAYEASEAYATVLAEIGELGETALALAASAKATGWPNATATLEHLVHASRQFRYVPIQDAGINARQAADLALDAVPRLTGLFN